MKNTPTVKPDHPIFCKDCNSADSWERHPPRDVLFESGKIFELAYRCKYCGAVTWWQNRA